MNCNHGNKSSATPKRLTYKVDHSHDNDQISQGQFEISQDVNAVKSVTDDIFERQGLYHSNHQAVEEPRAGIRRSLGRVLPAGILNKRVTDDFKKGTMPAEIREDHNRGIHRQFAVAPGVFGAVRGFFHKLRVGEKGLRFEQAFGSEQYDENTRVIAADRVLSDFDDTQITAVQNYLEAHGVPLPPMPAQIPQGIQAANPTYVQVVLQFASAMPSTVSEMRGELLVDGARLFPPNRMDPLHPTTAPVPPAHAIDRFLQLRKAEGKQSHNLQITTMYDTQRLGNVMRTIKTDFPDIYKLIVEDILEPDALHAIQGVPATEALIHYLEDRIRLKDSEFFTKELKAILGNIPDLEKKKSGKTDEELNKAEIKKLEGQVEKVMTNYGQLDDLYSKAPGVGKDLFKWNKNYLQISEQAGRGGNQQKGQESNMQTVNKNVKEAKTEKDKLFTDIRAMEGTFMKDAESLHKLLKDKDEAAIDGNANLKKFFEVFLNNTPAKSDEKSLFGNTEPKNAKNNYVEASRTEGTMRKAFDGFSAKELKAMKGEIEKDFSKGFKKKTKLTPFELLKALMEVEFAQKGIVAPENRSVNAMAAAEVLCNMARSKNVFRSANLEQQEWLASGNFGRAKKWFKAKFNIGGVQTAEDVIERISGMDSKTVAFRGLKKDITAEELVKFINERGIKEGTVFEFAGKLEEAFKRFEKGGHEGAVKLYEADAYDLEELTHLLMNVRGILRSRRYHLNEARALPGDKGEAIFEHIRSKRKSDIDDENALIERVTDKSAEWKTFFSKRVLKKKFFELLSQKIKERKQKKMSHEEFEESLDHEGLRTAYEELRTQLILKETKDTTIAAAKKTVKGVKWAFGKGGPVRTVGKAVAFPFVLAGSLVGGAWKMATKGSKGSSGSHKAAAHH